MFRLVLLIFSMIVAAVTFALLIQSAWSVRNVRTSPGRFSHSVAAEVIWTVVPCLMFVGAALPAAIKVWQTQTAQLSSAAGQNPSLTKLLALERHDGPQRRE